jgi:glycosyltransferase involved in cell wall biosynthesis
MKPSIVILTYNSAGSVRETLAAASQISDDIHIVDSFSSDETVAICRSYGASVIQHAFEDYGRQRNWAIKNLALKYAWQLHLDADEVLSPSLRVEIKSLSENPREAGFFVPRYLRFLGRVLKHGGMSPTWHLRLFRNGAGQCESRLYDQHFFLTEGESGKLSQPLIDNVVMSLSEWTSRHNRWSDLEVKEICLQETEARIVPAAFGDPVQRKRFQRGVYTRMPLFVRPFGLLCYRLFVCGGILDGTEGFIFWVLQTFWFRFLIDSKLFEKRKHESQDRTALQDSEPDAVSA